MKLNASNEGPTTHTQRVQFSTVKWTEGCTREASLSFEDSRWSRKITISERIGLLNGSRKSINEADKVVATTTLRLLTYLSTLELLLIFQFNRRYFARGRVDYNTWQDNPSTIERWTSSVFNYVAFGCNHARFEYRSRIKQSSHWMNCFKLGVRLDCYVQCACTQCTTRFSKRYSRYLTM